MRDGTGPADTQRHRSGRIGNAALPRRCRSQRRTNCRDRPHPRARGTHDRRRRVDRRARVHRRPHPYGCAGRLGPAWQLLLLARRHQRRHGQLRLRSRPVQARRQGVVRTLPDRGRGHSDRGDAGRYRLELGDLPRVSGECRAPAQGDQLRHVYRALRVADVRHGPARARRTGQRGRSAAYDVRGRRGGAGRSNGALDLAGHDARHSGGLTGRQPHRRLGGDRPARRRDGGARRRDLSDRSRHLRRRGATRVSRAPAPGCTGERAADHVRRARHAPRGRPEPVAISDPLYRRDRGGRRAHVRSGDDPLDQCGLLAKILSAVRCAARLAGGSLIADRGAEGAASPIRRSGAGWSRRKL